MFSVSCIIADLRQLFAHLPTSQSGLNFVRPCLLKLLSFLLECTRLSPLTRHRSLVEQIYILAHDLPRDIFPSPHPVPTSLWALPILVLITMHQFKAKVKAKQACDDKHSMKRSNSSMLRLSAQLMQQNRPLVMVNVVLVFVYAIDAFVTMLNVFHSLLIKIGVASPPSGDCVPPAFSPTSPPPFADWPFTHTYCRFVHLYNLFTGYNEDVRLHHDLYSRKPKNDWIRDWAYWEGIGHKGEWGTPYAATDQDSRSPCPGLNILASHGIIHRSGRKIPCSKLVQGIARAYNINPLMAFQLYSPLYGTLSDRDNVFDLGDLGILNVIEHDASMLRPDMYLSEMKDDPVTMSRPHQDLIDRWFPAHLKHGKVKEAVSETEFAHDIRIRRAECKKRNPQYSASVWQSLAGSGSCVLMLRIFGGKVLDLRDMAGTVEDDLPGIRTTASGEEYGYERIPARTIKVKEVKDGLPPVMKTVTQKWQPATVNRYFGMTIAEALYLTFKIEMYVRA